MLTGRNIKITLSPEQLELARLVAKERFEESRRNGFKDRHGIPIADRKAADVGGARGELAFAVALGVTWRGGVNEFKNIRDVSGCEVRHSIRERGCLIWRHARPGFKGDLRDAPYVFVTGDAAGFTVVGWMLGRDCDQEKWTFAPNGRTPARFVPQKSLHSFPVPEALTGRAVSGEQLGFGLLLPVPDRSGTTWGSSFDDGAVARGDGQPPETASRSE